MKADHVEGSFPVVLLQEIDSLIGWNHVFAKDEFDRILPTLPDGGGPR